ncbi:MAG: calcium-binding protein, partial [Kordiimonadaceae bacterium]|nr:calcium-binding protein [Kordiimonadaceae bacterium]
MADITGLVGNDGDLQGTADADTINPQTGDDSVSAGAGNDVITYSGGADTIRGEAGDDTIRIDSALTTSATIFDGGAGSDTLVVNQDFSNALAFTAFDQSGTSTIALTLGGVTTASLTGIEFIQFNDVTLNITAGAASVFTTDVTVASGTNRDVTVNATTFDPSNGFATVIADSSASFTIKSINGEAVDNVGQDDTTTLASGSTLIVKDTVAGTAADDSQIDYVSGNTNNFEDTTETVSIVISDGTNDITQTVVFTTAATAAPTSGPNTNVNGSAGADNINLLAGNDEAQGNAGNDTLTGGFGDDTLEGGTGDDVIAGDDGTDVAVFLGSIDAAAGSIKASVTTTANASDAGVSDGTDTLTSIEGIVARNLGTAADDGALAEGTVNAGALTGTSLNLGADATFGGVAAVTLAGAGTATVNLASSLLTYTTATGVVAVATAATGWTVTGITFGGVSDVAIASGDTFTIGTLGTLTVADTDLTKTGNITYTASSSNVGGTAQLEEVVVTITNGGDVRHIILDLTLGGINDTLTADAAGEAVSCGDGNVTITGGVGD